MPETDIRMINIESNSYVMKRVTSEQYEKEKESCFRKFDTWSPEYQIDFIEDLLLRMTHYQHGHINTFLKPMLQRDFISALPGRGLQPVAEKILSYLDADSLRSAEFVCNEWHRVIADGMLWKKLIYRKVLHDPLWKGLGERRGWINCINKPTQKSDHPY